VGLGSEQSSDPYRSVHVVEAREPALASEPASCGRTGGGVLPASSAYRPWGGEGRRARPLGILKAHRRRSHCRQDLRPLHTARSFSTTVALAAAAASCRLHLHLRLQAAVTVPPLSHMCPHIRPPRAVSQPQNSACAYVRVRLRARGWVPGRGACGETGAQTACQQARNRNLPCALEARASETAVYR
jgi:hypothetical protein